MSHSWLKLPTKTLILSLNEHIQPIQRITHTTKHTLLKCFSHYFLIRKCQQHSAIRMSKRQWKRTIYSRRQTQSEFVERNKTRLYKRISISIKLHMCKEDAVCIYLSRKHYSFKNNWHISLCQKLLIFVTFEL